MFNPDFFPTPIRVIELMVSKLSSIEGKVVLEPSAGKGNIVNFIKPMVKSVVAYEKEPELRKILDGTCYVMGDDFLNSNKQELSHIDIILMNPPFSEQNKHIQQAINVAPAGCEIVALCNASLVTTDKPSLPQQTILTYLKHYGYFDILGNVFSDAERKTNVEVALLYIQVPPDTYRMEFDGFFMEDTDTHSNKEGFMKYDFIRDIVNRYVEGVKLYDKVLESHSNIRRMVGDFYTKEILKFTDGDARENYKKQSQKDAWMYLFKMLSMEKFMTKNMKEQINKFVEQQLEVPFTMKNVYVMLDIVLQTTGQRMDKAMEEAFDKITSHHKDNKFDIEGWATNKSYILTKRFIIDGIGDYEKRWPNPYVRVTYRWNAEMIDDLVKTICYITGKDYDRIPKLETFVRDVYFRIDESGDFVLNKDLSYKSLWTESSENMAKYYDKQYPNTTLFKMQYNWGEWFEWSFFRVRVYMRGTAHFEFLDENVWALYNQNIARIKGLVLPKEQKQKARKRPVRNNKTAQYC